MINLLLLLLGLSLCLNVHLVHKAYKRYKWIRWAYENFDKVPERNNKVAEFRKKVLIELGSVIYDSMVSYETMLMSDLDLTLDNFIPDKYLEEAKRSWS